MAELNVEVYDKLIEMMRSSNPEDFFMGLELYKNHNRTHVLDLLMIKSFGGTKRIDFMKGIEFDEIKYNWRLRLNHFEKLVNNNNERLIFERLKDEYNY
tara:strand:- start:1135 stop:1431 length:297 start_codon:yes stop_codon:yes gene_type:complete